LGPATYTANCIYSDGASTPAVTCSGDPNHTGITVTWSTAGPAGGDTGSALVVGSGNTTTATAATNGTVTVIATSSKPGTCLANACKARLDVGLTGVNAISPSTPTIPKGTTQQFTVTGTFAGISGTQDITNYVTWSTANISPLTGINISINRVGLATALGPVGSTSTIFAGIDPCTSPGPLCQITSATVDKPTLVSIAITPATSPTNLAMGAKRQYTATGTYTDKSTVNITNSVVWSSSTPSSSNGADFSTTKPGQLIANSNATGSTTITASQNSVTSTPITVNISKAVLSSITVSPKNPSVPTGDSQQFTATGKYSDGTSITIWPAPGDANHAAAAAPIWSSSSPNAATIDASGLASAIGTNGTTTIKATSGTVAGSTVLTVAPAALKSIAITPTNASVAQNDTQQFTATGTFTDNSQKDVTADVRWSETDSSGGGNATISNASGSEGLATAVNQGTATIIATDPVTNVTSSVQMTITARALNTITVAPPNPTINAGSTQQFTATGNYNSTPFTQDITSSVTWTSDNTAVATIDASGLATAASAGSANITATQGSVTSTPAAVLTVSNPTLQSMTITPTGNVIAHINQTLQFTATGNYSDGSTQDLSAIATWSLQKNLGDSIDATGLYTAGKTAGSQTVTANCNSGQCGTGSANASQAFTVTF
jgi:trimeric autotransporter adhesin